MGGLLLQSMCVQARRVVDEGRLTGNDASRHEQLLASIRGVFLYSVPQAGARLADLALVKFLRHCHLAAAPLDCLTTLNRATQEMLEKFRQLQDSHKWRKGAVGEGRGIGVRRARLPFVPAAGSLYSINK